MSRLPQSPQLPRVAIYARYSSDAQSEHSIEDQVRVCRARAEREGWEVGEVYADYAISGASAARPRFQQLVTDARSGRFGLVLAEALDRISRDQEHIAGFYKQMNFSRVGIVTVAEGEISELHIGLKGTMSALFLKDLAQKTHRGLEGRVRQGASGGGLCFGYRIRRGLKPDGTPITGELEIAEEDAAVVRRIFRAYASGQSPRFIAKTLNSEGVPGSRGGKWTASLLLGGAARETGLLRNRLYVGERVWNRQHFVKDPNTGRRLARLNPPEAWVVTSVPGLRILDQEVWEVAQARLTASSTKAEMVESISARNLGARLGQERRPPWLLSGLVRCGLCQGPMTVVGAEGRLGCANHVERGNCTNKRTIRRQILTDRVLVGLKERLLVPELVEEFVRSYVIEIQTANRERGARTAKLAQEQARLGRQVQNFLDLIKEGHGSGAMVAELRKVEARQAELAAEIVTAEQPEPVPVPHPNLPALYRRRVEALEEALADPETAMAATEALRELIEAILVFPGERRGEVSLSLSGDLAAFLHAGEAAGSGTVLLAQNGKTPATHWSYGRFGEVLGSLDAGTGFEPVTFRL
jgi:site-specific DNA recombinase